MKLHLPVRLFRAVIALMAVAMPFSASARKHSVSDGQQLTLSGLDELDLNISGYYIKNTSEPFGGAIYARGTGAITIEHYVNLLFNKNYTESAQSSYSPRGGAIYISRGAITLSGNGSVTFSGNYTDDYGGAIYSDSGAITLSGNGSVTFSGNYAYSTSANGGAIYSYRGAITLSGNGSVTFSGNYSYEYGGAIYSDSGAITLSGNESVTFSGNYTDDYGGAIYSDSDNGITLSGNGSVTFSGNYTDDSSRYYSYGGAIYSESGGITLSGNASVTFSGNYTDDSTSYGGAIYGKNIHIRDNGSVVFKQNYEKSNSTYRLRGLYATGNTALSAASGNYIEFQESMYVGGVLELNNLYTNEAGKSVAQRGDIIFTGAYAAKHLGAIKSNYTADELNNSRTSNVSGMTTLYDGRLIVRDGAILSGARLTVASSASGYSTPTVLIENAKLNYAGATVSFASGSRLEARGQSGIGCSNLTMRSGSALTLHAAGGNMSSAVLSVYGSFTMGDSLTLNISFNDDTAEAGIYRLMSVTSFANAANWTADKVTVNGLDGFELSFDALYWEDNTLYLNYDGNTGVGIPPTLTKATWDNLSGTHEWDMSDKNWKQDKYTYAYSDGVAVVFGDTAAGGVVLVGELAPDSVLVNNSEGHGYTWEGDPTKGGSLTGNMSLTKKGDGSLSIYTDNSYLGDTVIEGGKLVVGSADALGKGTVRLMGGTLEIATNDFDNHITAGGTAEIMVQQGSSLKLKRKIYNTEGILTLKGTIDVSALESVHIDAALVDVNGEIGTSGFARAAATGVQLVQGGMVEAAGATVLYNGEVLQVDTTGFGATIPTIDYSVYSINGRHSVATSAINAQAGAALTCIDLNSGTLTADTAVSNLKALGGTLLMPQQVTVNGSVQDTLVYASAGQLNATLSGGSAVQVSGAVSISGNNTHTGGTILNNGSLTVTNSKALGTGSIITQGSSSIKANAALTLTEAIINTGTLTLSGRYNVSALELIGSGSVRVDVTGNTGASGFLKSGGSRVLVVAGGTVVNNGATVTYNGTNLTLGSDGYATMGSTGIDYSEYLLTGTDTVATSAIHSGAGAGAVIRQQGGTLTVNDMAEVNATGGSIILKTGGLLSGTLSGSTITAEGGSLMASLSGSNTINGDGYVLNSLFNNEGMLVLSGSFDVSALSLETSAGGRVDLNGNVTTAGNGFARSEGKRVQLTTGGSTSDGGVSINYLDIQLKLGTDGYATSGGETDYSTYYQTSGAASTQAIHLASAAASVEMSGGTLTVNDFATVQSSGGNIIVANNGDLRGSVSSATVTAQGGNIGALFKGTNTLTGQNYNLTNVLQNAGALTLKGSFKTDALQLETVQSSRINTEGQTGNSGFLQHGGFRVQLVSGGTVLNGGATVKYGSTVLSLGSDGYAYNGGGIDYSEYLLTGTDSAVLSKIISAGGSALSIISMNGGVLTVDADTALLNATGGTINAVSGTLGGSVCDATINASGGTINAILLGDTSVQITGVVSMEGYNSHTGGVLLNNGTLTLHNVEALGGGSIVSMGVSALQLNDTLVLSEVMLNMGTLSLSGNIDASALTADTGAEVYVNTEGVIGSSGFLQSGGYRVQIVTGGTVVNNDVEITYNGDTLTLGTDGYASSGGGTSYGTYYLNGSDSVRVSEALAASGYALGGIQMTGGTLYADAATKVTATGGNIMLSSGVLSGTVSNAQVNATGGTISAKLSGVASLAASGTVSITGANTHSGGTSFSGGNFTLAHGAALGNGLVVMAGTNTLAATTVVTLNDSIINNGALTMTGTYDASALELSSVGISYVDCLGNTGNSGFQKEAGHSVQVVNGGTVSGNATIKHGSLTLTLGSDGYATDGGGISYGTYYLNSGDSVSVSAAEAASANALTTVSMSGGTLYADAATKVTASGGNIMLSSGVLSGTVSDAQVNATGGTLSAKLSGASSLSVKGTLTLSGANTHTGGTIFNGGTFTLGNGAVLGSGSVVCVGDNTLKASTNIQLGTVLQNEGHLMLTGTYNASGLVLNTIGACYVDADGNVSSSGFQQAAGHSVQVVNGGTVSGNATIKHGSLTLTLGSDGYATDGGGISYGTYYLFSGDSVSVSAAEAASANALTTVSMSGGTLYADATTKVTATGGNIMLSAGTLSGTAKNTHVTATGGTLSAALSGTGSLNAKGTMTISGANSHTGGSIFNGGTFTLSNATSLGNGNVMTIGTNTLKANTAQTLKGSILNSGTLTLSGSWNISALALQTTAATHVDIYGHSGASGFAKSALYEVQVVLGGTSKVNNLTLTHSKLGSGLKLLLGSDGVASAGGVVDYSNYLLTEGDSADASDILGAAGGKLDNVTMTGGNLNVDDSVEVDATGGKITITDDSTLSGSITDTEVTLGEGNYKSDISADITGDSSLTINGGDVTLSGENNYTGGTVINGGSLTAGDDTALGSGSITVNGGTLDLNDQELGNDITLNDGHLTGNNNYNGNLSIGGDNVTVEGGYTLAAGKVLEIAAGGTEFGSDLTLAGGTLLFKGAPLTVDGEVSFAAGTTTLVDLRQWEGQLVDGLTLAVLGNDITGWADGCLELIGMSDMSLGFDAATGTLTLQIAGQKPVADVITWLGAKQTVWQHGKAGWMNASTGYDAVYENGAAVIFTQAGTVTIAGAVAPGSVIVAGDKAITFKADKKNPGRIVGETSLTKRGNGKLTLNDGNTYSGGTSIEAGTVTAGGASSFGSGEIAISGGTLDLKSKAVTNNITLTGVATIKGGNKFGGELTLDGELLKGSVLNVAEAAELKSGTMNGTLSGIGTVTVSGEATLGTTGKITTNGLDIEGTLNVGTKGLAMNAKSSAITVEEGGKLLSAGQLKAYSMDVRGGEVMFTTAKATSVTLGGDLRMSEGASMSLSGKLNVGNLYMDNAQLLLRDPSGKNAAMGLTAKGNVTLGSGSALTLSGKLTAANLTLDGGALTLTSNKLQTITVKNTLTLGAAFDLNFSFNLTEGKAVKLFTFKSITGNTADLYAQLGLSDEFCTLTLNARDITLLVTDLDGLRGYMENTAKADASAAEPEEEEVSAEELLAEAAPVAAAADIDPLLAKAADTLVQSTWGTVGASRAFGETIAGRGRNATLLGEEGKGAAWLSVMGGSSRISSAEGHNGADFTLSGAAFGVEGRVGEKSTLGVAIGNSWGKVSTFSAFPVDQDSMHVGIYGNHTLTKSLTLSWMATHTRTESEATILGAPYSWSQDALQLDARLTWGKSISDKTAVSAFAGLQYLATDSGECAGLKTGSLQNLRAELGVGASHKLDESTLVFGELSFIGDMVRNNPTAAIGDERTHGTNPGRVGLNLSVGAQHQLSEDWSLNASYSLELMENSTSHSLNVGASYSF